MAEVSNRTLAFLLVGAIVISLGGTLISLNRLGQLGAASVTGAASTGDVSMTIQSDTSYNVTDTVINFGSGFITGGSTYAILDSDADLNQFWSGSETLDYLTVQNDGNERINVTFTSNFNASGFLGGTNPDFNYTAFEDDLHSCTGGSLGTGNVVNESGSANDMDVCDNLAFGGAPDYNDTINVSIRLRFETDASQTGTTATLTFDAVQSLIP